MDLIQKIKEFANKIVKIPGILVTPKMHHLIAHTIPNVLEKYHTVGFFTEYALESIHALVNKLCQKFIQIGGDRRVTQFLHSLQLQKQDLHLAKSKAVKEEKNEVLAHLEQNKQWVKLRKSRLITK